MRKKAIGVYLYKIDNSTYRLYKMNGNLQSCIIKKISFLVMVLGFSCVAMAQQEPQFTQYMFNRMSYNPGYAGSSGSISAALMYRNQWMGLSLDKPAGGGETGSTPTDILFTFDLPVKFLHGGLGLTFVKDEIGYHDNMLIDLNYAFRIYWGQGTLAAAVAANLYNYSFDWASMHGSDDYTGTSSDPVGGSIDPLLAGSGKVSDFLFDLSTGLYYQVPGQYYLGLSVKNLLASESKEMNMSNARTIYAMGGYSYTPSNYPTLKLKPSFLLKTANFSTFQADVSMLLDYRNVFWAGASYRVQDAIAFLAGVQFGKPWKMKIGTAYDLTTSKLGTFKPGRSNGTVELYMQFCFKVVVPQKPPTVYGNTRYLLW